MVIEIFYTVSFHLFCVFYVGKYGNQKYYSIK